ncbi:MAG: hypothetical protein HGB08_03000 [Candidatus Moranbacteria bacterium]|nr:hypothetical protein [Candidatus Moranbacteria bacterium]
MIKKYKAWFSAIFSLVIIFPMNVFASMTSETYSIDSGRIGTGEISLPYAQSESYSFQATPSGEVSLNPAVSEDDSGGRGSTKRSSKNDNSKGDDASQYVGQNINKKESIIPRKLFDINLEIGNPEITDIKNLSARVIFTSFGTELTPVDMVFAVVDQAGNEAYRSENHTDVQTESVFNKDFKDADHDLPLGKYVLVLTTTYNVNVVDEFRADFEIVKVPSWKNRWIWIGISIAFLMSAAIMVRNKRRGK